jgi:hypothetical protein
MKKYRLGVEESATEKSRFPRYSVEFGLEVVYYRSAYCSGVRSPCPGFGILQATGVCAACPSGHRGFAGLRVSWLWRSLSTLCPKDQRSLSWLWRSQYITHTDPHDQDLPMGSWSWLRWLCIGYPKAWTWTCTAHTRLSMLGLMGL